MKKKFLSFVLAICMIIPCVFMLSACGKGGNNTKKDDTSLILEKEWKSTISTSNNFTIMDFDEFRLDYTDGEMKIEEGQNKGEYQIYSKSVDGSTKYYCEEKKQTDSKYISNYDYNVLLKYEIDEQIYNENVNPYMEIIDFVGNNYSKFECEKYKIFGGYGYRYVLQLSDELDNTTYAKNLNIEKICVKRSIDDTTIKLNTNQSSVDILYYIGEKVYEIEFESPLWKALNNLENFKTTGGPSGDYIEYTSTSNGMKIYTPTIEDQTRKEMYFKFDKDTSDYVLYRQNESGEWTVSLSTESTYNDVTNVIDSLYFAFKKHMCSFYMTSEGYKSDVCNNKDIDDMKYGNYVVNYSDILLTTDDLGNITGGTLKFKLKLGELQSEAYVITITTTDISITYPETGAHSHSYESDWSNNDEYHWHACEDSTCVDCQDKVKHDFDEGTIVKPASMENKGTIKYTCRTCGKEVTKSFTKFVSDEDLPVEDEEEWKDSFDAEKCEWFSITESVDSGSKTEFSKFEYYRLDQITIYYGTEFLEGDYTRYKIEKDKYIKYDVEDYYPKSEKIEITKAEYDGVLAEHDIKNLIDYNDIKDNYNYFAQRYELDSYVFNGETVTDIEIYFRPGYHEIDIYFTNSDGYRCNYYIKYAH